MNTPVVYSITGVGGFSTYYATKAEAIADARHEAEAHDPKYGDVEVWANYISTTMKRRKLHAALLNGQGWMSDRELVEKFPCCGKEE